MCLTMTLVVALELVLPGIDDPPPRVDLVGSAPSLSMLLDNPRVHKELALSPDQTRSCMLLAERTRNRLAAAYRAIRSRDSSSSEAPDRAPREIEASHSKEMIESITKTLTPEQLARFKQIALQSGTVATFLEPSVKAALKLDDRQQAAMHAIQSEARRTIQAEVKAGKLGREEIVKKALALRQEGRSKALALLSPEQKATWDALIGEPFFPEEVSPRDVGPRKEG